MYFWFFQLHHLRGVPVPMVPGRIRVCRILLRFLGYIAINDQFKYLGLVG